MSISHFSLLFRVKRNLSHLLAVLLVFASAAPLSAQIVETGNITGVVKDNTGAVIPNAPVTIRNAETGIASNISTDAQGLYVSPPLHPGNYTVEIDVPGFSKVVEKVRLEVGQRVAANSTLKVGSNAETIEVQASGQLLETESSSVGNLRTEEAVKDLPLNGRNFNELFSLGAGVIPTTTQSVSIPYTQQRGPSYFAINGSRPQENRTLLDGIGDQENHNSMTALFPPIDAIQEFSEETQDADARYGRGNGGTINAVIKSGTSRYHGDVFEFLRNTALDARNDFNIPKAGPTGQKAALRQNEFGATFGGPVFWKQANPKTFFFADYAGKRFAQGQTNVESVPVVNITSAGYDFSAYSAAIKNPLTHAAYAKNFVPINDPLIDPTGANILNFYQKYAQPNYGSAGATANNFFYGPLLIINEDDFDAKIDRKFTEKDSAFLRYSQGHDIFSQPGILPTPLVGDVICGPASDPAHQAVLSETHVFSPTIVNTARYGWTRFFVYAKNWDAGLELASPSNLNIPGVINPNNSLSDGLPVMTFTGYTAIGDAGNSPTNIGTNNYQWDDDLSLVRGKHSLDLGFDLIRLEYNMFQTGAEHGSESYATRYTGLPWSDLLFGAPTSGTYSFPSEVGLRQSDLSFYAQDNYKVDNRLTLNLGVHYENFLGWPWTEVHNKEYAFLPSISTTALEQVGTSGVPKSGLSGNNANFAPRLGAAYKITNKTVIHAGFGFYFAAPDVGNSSSLSANVPVDDYWAFNNPAAYVAGATSSAVFNYAQNGYAHTPVTSGSAVRPNTPAFAVDPNAKTPYTMQWHAAIEQEIPFSTILKFAYVGTKGTHLDSFRDINTNPLVAGTNSVTYNRPYGIPGVGGAVFAQISELETRQISSYNAVQVTAERRAHGLSFLASYTYSHALDEGSAESPTVTNPYNLRYDYGNADYNVPNRFVASSNYQLPFKGSGFLGPLERGWQVNAIAQFFDGLPFSVASGTALGDGLTPRAQLAPGVGNGSLPKGQRTLSQWFNTQAFSVPAAGTYGNSGRNILEGPGTKAVDFSLFKDTHLTESKVLQLRAEAFNLANTPQFNNPAATVGTYNATTGKWSNGFGTISSAASESTFQRTERQIQFAAKITF
ncbi:MAG: carboxypeptidase regulatory-like domain-containing protein [Terracidiphilus sp.]